MAAFPIIGGTRMDNKIRLKPLSEMEQKFADENYHLIMEFLRKSRLDPEEYFDVVIFEYLLAVEIYLNNTELQERCSFEAVSYMHMKRAVFKHFRKQKAEKRCSEAGSDVCFEDLETYVGDTEHISDLEYAETIKEIKRGLTEEQQRIFLEKINGYSLKEIAEISGIKPKRVYNQFAKIKSVVAEVMEI